MPVIFFEMKKSGLAERNKLKKFIINIGKKEFTRLKDIRIIFCSDEYLLEINRCFLQHDYYTDIITFDLTEPGQAEKNAEIYISIDRIKIHSIDYQTTIKKELHRVIFHGILHLCGYKDKKNSEKKIMRDKEDFYLSKYFQ